MNFLTISLLLFAAALHASKSTQKKAPLLQYNTRKVNGQPQDQTNCFCYPDGPLPTVHQLLDLQDQGLERVVIYLYKNVGSTDIRMYTPSLDKQVLIPDIPYEPGDQLITLTTEPVTTIFRNNPHKIKVYNNRFEIEQPSSTITDALPIGLNVGVLEHVRPDNDPNLTPNNKVYSGLDGYIIDINNQLNGNIVTESNQDSIKNNPEIGIVELLNYPGSDNGYNTPQVIEQPYFNAINYPYQNFQTENKQISNIDAATVNVYTFNANNGSYDLLTGSTGQDWNNPDHQYLTFNIWFNVQMKRFQKIHLPQDIKIIDEDLLKYLVNKTLSDNNIRVGSDGLIRDSKGVIVDAANLELRPMLIGEKVDYEILKSKQNSGSKIILPKHLPYLEGILVTLVYPPQILGIIPLGKTYLPETSAVRGSESQLSYVNGTQIYLASNPTETSYVFKNMASPIYSGGNSGLVSYYPYFDVNNKPITSYSQSRYYIEPPSYSYQTIKKEPYYISSDVSYLSNESYLATVEPILTAKDPLGERRKLSNAKVKHHSEPPPSKKKKKGPTTLTTKNSSEYKETVNISQEDTVDESLLSVNTSDSAKKFPVPLLKGVMKTLLYLISNSGKQKDNTTNSTEEVNIINESENPNDGERPDFRIIGGNAATGSGTPLSNKGRSGSYDYV